MTEMKQVLKAIKFPGGADAYATADYARWNKRGGHGGAKSLERVRESLGRLGFEQVDASLSSDATGDRVGSGTRYVKLNVTVTLDAYYGCTAYENRFTITVKVAAKS